MFGFGKNKISTESYKGVRDFFPEDQAIQNYIFDVMRRTVESWGYEEYNASVLEPLDLYKSKTSEEIISEQIYSFKDRGGRDVVLRPEMTPTVARMVAKKIHDLPLPIRWYSIPNVFRYEKPQRGRLREHWQLNVDIFGIEGYLADAEVIQIAWNILINFGSKDKDFVIKINNRMLLDEVFEGIGVLTEEKGGLLRLLDKKDKMSEDSFRKSIIDLIGNDKAVSFFENLYYGEGLLSMMQNSKNAKETSKLIQTLKQRGITNVVFSPTLTRGFDYYTGTVFEVYDTNDLNPRSIFGGGRYDNLVNSFTNRTITAFGFGMGDVTTKDFLTTHGLLPEIFSTTDLYLCCAPDTDIEQVYNVAYLFRKKGINTSIDISQKKLSDQLKKLDKKNILYVMTIGTEELKNNLYTLRNTKTREETKGTVEELAEFILKNK